MRYVCFFLSTLLFLNISASAAFFSFISGEIASEQPYDFASLEVELQDLTNLSAPPERTHVNNDGRFEIRNVSEGQYLLYIKTEMGEVLHRDILQIQTAERRVYIRLHGAQKQRPASGVVSWNELTHKPPKEARKAFNKSVKLQEKGDSEGAVVWLRKAVELDPQYMHAINNLGVRYMLSGRLDEAIVLFRRASELDPHAVGAHSNLAHCLVIKGDAPAAEVEARKSVELDKGDAKAAYLLGLSLVMQGKFTPEAVANLRKSEHISPRAQLTFALALARTGSVKDARETLGACLKSNDGPVRQEAQRLLAVLH